MKNPVRFCLIRSSTGTLEGPRGAGPLKGREDILMRFYDAPMRDAQALLTRLLSTYLLQRGKAPLQRIDVPLLRGKLPLLLVDELPLGRQRSVLVDGVEH